MGKEGGLGEEGWRKKGKRQGRGMEKGKQNNGGWTSLAHPHQLREAGLSPRPRGRLSFSSRAVTVSKTGVFLKIASDGQDKDPRGERSVIYVDGRGPERDTEHYCVMAVTEGRDGKKKMPMAILPQPWLSVLAGD